MGSIPTALELEERSHAFLVKFAALQSSKTVPSRLCSIDSVFSLDVTDALAI
jgi:hypothetical protein